MDFDGNFLKKEINKLGNFRSIYKDYSEPTFDWIYLYFNTFMEGLMHDL